MIDQYLKFSSDDTVSILLWVNYRSICCLYHSELMFSVKPFLSFSRISLHWTKKPRRNRPWGNGATTTFAFVLHYITCVIYIGYNFQCSFLEKKCWISHEASGNGMSSATLEFVASITISIFCTLYIVPLNCSISLLTKLARILVKL